MRLTTEHINSILINEDIEGLIELGAPEDEYYDEAAQLLAAINVYDGDLDDNAISALLTIIWTKSFGLDQEELSKRLDDIGKTASAIYQIYSR
jgi:hypothetical protein